jgi:hypothetical protein
VVDHLMSTADSFAFSLRAAGFEARAPAGQTGQGVILSGIPATVLQSRSGGFPNAAYLFVEPAEVDLVLFEGLLLGVRWAVLLHVDLGWVAANGV